MCAPRPSGQEEYLHLRPVSDLSTLVREALYHEIRTPESWSPSEPDDEIRDDVIDRFAYHVSAEVDTIVRRRVRTDRMRDWRAAYEQSGPGSTKRRAKIVDENILTPAAPESATVNGLVDEVRGAIERAARDLGITLR